MCLPWVLQWVPSILIAKIVTRTADIGSFRPVYYNFTRVMLYSTASYFIFSLVIAGVIRNHKDSIHR